MANIDKVTLNGTDYTIVDSTVPSWAKNSTKPTYNGGEVKYTGTTGNVVTNDTTLNVAVQALDTAMNNRLKYVLLSQAEYDALTTKDSGTMYLIQNVVTYSVTSTYSGNIDSGYYRINDGENNPLEYPISVNEGDKFYWYVAIAKQSKPTVTMGGDTITLIADEPGTWYFSIQSVTGDIVISD